MSSSGPFMKQKSDMLLMRSTTVRLSGLPGKEPRLTISVYTIAPVTGKYFPRISFKLEVFATVQKHHVLMTVINSVTYHSITK